MKAFNNLLTCGTFIRLIEKRVYIVPKALFSYKFLLIRPLHIHE